MFLLKWKSFIQHYIPFFSNLLNRWAEYIFRCKFIFRKIDLFCYYKKPLRFHDFSESKIFHHCVPFCANKHGHLHEKIKWFKFSMIGKYRKTQCNVRFTGPREVRNVPIMKVYNFIWMDMVVYNVLDSSGHHRLTSTSIKFYHCVQDNDWL